MSLLLDARKKSQQAQFAQDESRASQNFKINLDGYPNTDTPEPDARPTANARSAGQNLFAAKLAMPPVTHLGIKRNLLFALGGTILLLGVGVAYLWYIDSASSTTPLRPDSASPSGQLSQPVAAVTGVAPSTTLVPGVSEPGHVGSQESQPTATAHVESAHSPRQDDVTTGETTDVTTSHLTKLSKNDSQVIGYSRSTRLSAEKLLA